MILPPRKHTIPGIPTTEVALMAAKRNAISKESERRDPCARPTGSLPNEPNMDIAGDAWAARHNGEIWNNESGFRNQADGFFD